MKKTFIIFLALFCAGVVALPVAAVEPQENAQPGASEEKPAEQTPNKTEQPSTTQTQTQKPETRQPDRYVEKPAAKPAKPATKPAPEAEPAPEEEEEEAQPEAEDEAEAEAEAKPSTNPADLKHSSDEEREFAKQQAEDVQNKFRGQWTPVFVGSLVATVAFAVLAIIIRNGGRTRR